MKLIVGLGNPTKKYEKTRHNMGFMAIDRFADMAQVDIDKELFKGLLGRSKLFGHDVLLFKPQTYMNLSGDAVVLLVNYFKIDISDILVIYDDMALNPGTIRLRESGSAGGQKGMEDIINKLHTKDIKRLRVGIGQPTYADVKDYVLGKPIDEEVELIDKALDKAVDAIKEYLKSSFPKAMSLYNN